MDVLELFESKAAGGGDFRRAALLASRSLARDVRKFLIKGLERAGRVVFARY